MVQPVQQELLAQLVLTDPPELPEPREERVDPAQVAQREPREQQVLTDPLGQPELTVLPVQPGVLVAQEQQAPRGVPDQQEQSV